MSNEVENSLLERLAALRDSHITPKAEPVSSVEVDVIERKKPPTRETELADRLNNLRNGGPNPSQKTSTSAASSENSSLVDRLNRLRSGAASLTYEGTTEREVYQREGAGIKAGRSSNTTAAAGDKRASSRNGAFTATTDLSQVVDEEDDVENAFHTDDKELEDLLRDVVEDETVDQNIPEPSDGEVQALLQKLVDFVPPKSRIAHENNRHESGEELEENSNKNGDENDNNNDDDDDDSDGEIMKQKVDDIIARFRDELDLEKNNINNDEHSNNDIDHESAAPDGKDGNLPIGGKEDKDDDDDATETESDNGQNTAISFPEVPKDKDQPDRGSAPGKSKNSETVDSLTSRLLALQASSPSASSNSKIDDSSLSLPTVPSTAPDNVKRLTSKTAYTDDDLSKWCIVCLDDASLTCLGCDEDPYCVRCWKEMHVGPRAGFDEREHQAVEFGKKKKKKVAVGA